MSDQNDTFTDSEVVYAHLQGDREAFGILVERYSKPLYRFIFQIVKSQHDTEDVIQEVFIKVWKYAKKYDSKQSFKTWIFTIARNTTLDWLRKRKHIAFSKFENEDGDNIFEDTLTDDEPLADEIFVMAENKKLIESLLSKLPPPQQEVLILHYHEDLTFEEISTVLKEPLNTVKSRHRRSLISLKKIMHQNKP